MISDTELQIARDAITMMGSAFEDLMVVCRGLDESDKKRLFNPVTFGPISQFLGLGNGWEAGDPGPQFTSAETLTGILGGYCEESYEDAEEDSEVMSTLNFEDEPTKFQSMSFQSTPNDGPNPFESWEADSHKFELSQEPPAPGAIGFQPEDSDVILRPDEDGDDDSEIDF